MDSDAYDNYDICDMLATGKIDAFFAEEHFVELIKTLSGYYYDKDVEFVVEELSSPISIPVSMSTANPDLNPVISVMQKALQNGAGEYLKELYKRGQQQWDNIVQLYLLGSDDDFSLLQERAVEVIEAYIINNNYELAYEIGSGILSGDLAWIMENMMKIYNETGVDFCMITDADGIVVARTHAPEIVGTDAGNMDVVRLALDNQWGEIISTIEYVDSEMAACAGIAIYHEGRLAGTVIVGLRESNKSSGSSPQNNNAAAPAESDMIKITVKTFEGDGLLTQLNSVIKAHYPNVEFVTAGEYPNTYEFSQGITVRMIAGEYIDYDIMLITYDMMDIFGDMLYDFTDLPVIKNAADNVQYPSWLKDNDGRVKAIQFFYLTYGININSDKADLCAEIFSNLYNPDSDLHKAVTMANAVNNGIIDNGWLYFERWDNNKFYRIMEDGSSLQLLTEKYTRDINIEDGYIYYTAFDTWIDYGIYKMKTDGSAVTKIYDRHSWGPVVYKGWIYYANGVEDNKVYRIDVNGRNNEIIYDGECYHMLTPDRENGFIYFYNENYDLMLYDTSRNELKKEN
jgi:hypothetical protein